MGKEIFKKVSVLIISLIIVFTTGCVGNRPSGFAVAFNKENGNAAIVYRSADEVEMPEDPQRPGWVFEGWYFDKGIWQEPCTKELLDIRLNEGEKNLNIYAKWRVKKDASSVEEVLSEIENATLAIDFTGNYRITASSMFVGYSANNTVVQETYDARLDMREFAINDGIYPEFSTYVYVFDGQAISYRTLDGYTEAADISDFEGFGSEAADFYLSDADKRQITVFSKSEDSTGTSYVLELNPTALNEFFTDSFGLPSWVISGIKLKVVTDVSGVLKKMSYEFSATDQRFILELYFDFGPHLSVEPPETIIYGRDEATAKELIDAINSTVSVASKKINFSFLPKSYGAYTEKRIQIAEHRSEDTYSYKYKVTSVGSIGTPENLSAYYYNSKAYIGHYGGYKSILDIGEDKFIADYRRSYLLDLLNEDAIESAAKESKSGYTQYKTTLKDKKAVFDEYLRYEPEAVSNTPSTISVILNVQSGLVTKAEFDISSYCYISNYDKYEYFNSVFSMTLSGFGESAPDYTEELRDYGKIHHKLNKLSENEYATDFARALYVVDYENDTVLFWSYDGFTELDLNRMELINFYYCESYITTFATGGNMIFYTDYYQPKKIMCHDRDTGIVSNFYDFESPVKKLVWGGTGLYVLCEDRKLYFLDAETYISKQCLSYVYDEIMYYNQVDNLLVLFDTRRPSYYSAEKGLIVADDSVIGYGMYSFSIYVDDDGLHVLGNVYDRENPKNLLYSYSDPDFEAAYLKHENYLFYKEYLLIDNQAAMLPNIKSFGLAGAFATKNHRAVITFEGEIIVFAKADND